MFSCSICDHRKIALSTEPEYEFRRRKRNSEEMELYGVSNYCSECQLVTFFVNLVNFEGPLRGSLMWKILWAAAENVGKMPLQKSQDAGVQTRALEIDNPFVIVMAPPASREMIGHQEKEAEESSVGFSETDTQFDKVIKNILNTSSDTDSVSSHKVEELTVLYRRQPETRPDYHSSTCRSVGVDHASARRIPPALPHLQCEMKQKKKRLEELVTIGRRLEDKTTKLRMEMAALEKQKQQEEISEWQREADSALACESSWWGRENLNTVFGKWSPERRDKNMEDQANFLLQALEEQSGVKDRESDTDYRSLKDGKTETKIYKEILKMFHKRGVPGTVASYWTFSTHVRYDHQNVMLERMDLGQTKTFHLDPRLAKKNMPTCHMVYFVRDMIIDPPRGKMRDVLPVLVMTARMHSCDVSTSKSPTSDACPEDDTLQFLLIWLCTFKPTNVRVVGTLSVEATCAYVADSLMVRTARAYDIRAPQDMRTIYRSPSTLIMPYDLVRRITQRGNRSLTVKVKIE
ncbi:GL24684 [Drosophila persimilis]|uniref:GL24684 n=1 Tax=Drosophila persimilis TaxID=7234 RepID=B4H610_DROPE|nr:GL24684 [Drosophila persimilis]